MIEAYEIGIKLALQDGVSEGIAAIRRDLGSLDLAIAQTTLRLNQLQRVGAQALAASQEQPERPAAGVPVRRSAAVVTPPPPTEAEPMVTPAEMQAAVQTSIPRPSPVAGPAAVLAAPRMAAGEPVPVSPAIVARPEVAASETAPRLPAVVVEAVRAPGSSRLPEQPTAAPLVGTVLPTPSMPVPAAARVVLPTLQAGDPQRQSDARTQEAILPRTGQGVSAARASATAHPPQAVVESGRRERARLPVHHQEEVRERHVRQVAASLDTPSARTAPAPASPAAVFSPAAALAPSASPSYAPPAPSSRSSETGMRGDVFLDGTRVGRWMSEQMARDAGRPNTGPTGFDPRRSPAWPGAAVTW